MTLREKRLAFSAVIIGAVAALVLVDGFISQKIGVQKQDNKKLEQTLAQQTVLEEFAEETLAQRKQLDTIPSVPLSQLAAKDLLLMSLAQYVVEAGLVIQDQELLEASPMEPWGQVRARLVVTGEEQALYILLVQLRDPQLLQSIEALVLTPEENLTVMKADITVRRLFTPVDSVSPQ